MCIVIIQGVTENQAVEVGIYVSIQSIQSDDKLGNVDFFPKNVKSGKYLSRDLVCHFRVKDDHTLIWLSDSGSNTSEILVDVWKSLDSLRIYPKDDNHPKLFL